MPLSKKFGFILVVVSSLTAWLIANVGLDHQKLEMASIANTFGPPLCGITSLVLFLIIDRTFKSKRLILVLVLIVINLAVAIMIRIESETIAQRAGAENNGPVLSEQYS